MGKKLGGMADGGRESERMKGRRGRGTIMAVALLLHDPSIQTLASRTVRVPRNNNAKHANETQSRVLFV